MANQENYALDSFVCDAGTFYIQVLEMRENYIEDLKGHLSDDEMVETPMPGRVRRVIRHKRRQQKAAQVNLSFSLSIG